MVRLIPRFQINHIQIQTKPRLIIECRSEFIVNTTVYDKFFPDDVFSVISSWMYNDK